ncbi:hypothetical protein ABW20_dc0110336 [Dactylellina cionopaga]|nr:hypothetical protein ABW20_dc0110336 [Dactylellina cionopaga]
MERESKIAPLEVEDEVEHEDKGFNLVNAGVGKYTSDGKLKATRKKTPPVTRDTAFLHLDATIPPDLKYGLHQLMIRHGRYCPTCNAVGGRKQGIGQNGKPLVGKLKQITVKEEKDDGTFEETETELVIKEEPVNSEDEGEKGLSAVVGASDLQIKIEGEGEASELDQKPYVPIDAAGGTGQKTGGNLDGSCILGNMISWERLI